MPDLTDREFLLLKQSIDVAGDSAKDASKLLANLRVDLEKRFLTKDDDDKHDEEMLDALRTEMHDQGSSIRLEIVDMKAGFDRIIHILMWVIGLEGTAILFLFGHQFGSKLLGN